MHPDNRASWDFVPCTIHLPDAECPLFSHNGLILGTFPQNTPPLFPVLDRTTVELSRHDSASAPNQTPGTTLLRLFHRYAAHPSYPKGFLYALNQQQECINSKRQREQSPVVTGKTRV